MGVEKVVLPAGIALGALFVLGAVALVLRSRRSREQDKLTAKQREELVKERREAWRRRLAVISLAIAFVIIFCIAGIAAWLSFGAQKAYAFDRNGGSWSAATGFALLLDAGALGLSLMRLFEALTARSSQLTRLYLVGFIIASATMNLLHAPHAPGESPSFGGRLVAVIPPLVYAIFLETLLQKVEQLVLGKYPRKKVKKSTERGYSLVLWVPFIGYPWQMWKKWREDLHDTLQYVRAPGSRNPLPASPQEQEAAVEPPAPATEQPTAPKPAPAVAPAPEAAARSASGAEVSVSAPTPTVASASVPAPAARVPEPAAPTVPQEPARPSRSAAAAAAATPNLPPAIPAPRTKKEQLFTALVEQLRQGDLRVLSDNSQIRNAAAYQANKQLGMAAGQPEGLMTETSVRNTVKQLLEDLRHARDDIERERAAAAAQPSPAEPAPEHASTPAASEPAAPSRERDEEGPAPAVGPQRTAAEAAEAQENTEPREPSYA
jgi:hypothetical protein